MTRKTARLSFAALLLVFASTLFFRLGAEPPSGAEERCYGVAAKMIESGDWLVPHFKRGVRFQKPPLCYWALATARTLTGDSSYAAARLPSALAALGLVALVFVWGRRLAGEEVGLLAAFLLTAMSQFFEYGRSAVADMPLAFFSVAALLAFDRAYWGRSRRAIPAFFALVWLAFLAKATVVLLLVGFPIALRLSLDRAWGRVLRLDVAVCALVCAGASLGWYAAVISQVPGAWEEFRGAALHPVGLAPAEAHGKSHVRPFWYHLPKLLAASFPAVLSVPLLIGSRRDPGPDDPSRAAFPGLCFLSLFVAFSLIPMKQRHYMLPLLPMLAVAMAPLLAASFRLRRPRLEQAARLAATAILVASLPWLGLTAAHGWAASEPVAGWLALCALIAGATAAAVAAARVRNVRAFALACWILSWTGLGVVQIAFYPWIKSFHDETVAAQPGYDESRWSRLFAWQPWTRALYQAEDWQPGIAKHPRPQPSASRSPRFSSASSQGFEKTARTPTRARSSGASSSFQPVISMRTASGRSAATRSSS